MNSNARRGCQPHLTRMLGSALLVAAVLAPVALACAQTQRSGGGANAQIMQQYQQLASERTRLQADNDKLKTDLDALTKERDALKKERDVLKARAGSAGSAGNASAQVAAATAAAEERLATQRRQMDELVVRYREVGTNLQDVERQRSALQTQNDKILQAATLCADKNAKLRDLTTEVLDRFEHLGSFSKATIDEPFTRLTRTRVDNLVDESRNRIEELKVVAPTPTPGSR